MEEEINYIDDSSDLGFFAELILDIITFGFTILLIGLMVFLYFIPYSIAKNRDHPHKNAIFWVNLLFGLTGWGWIIAIIWAYQHKPEHQQA